MPSVLPRFVEPALATLVKAVPDGDEWLHELKYDGYRILGRLEDGRAELLSRRAKYWTEDFAVVAQALSKLRARRAIVDGEVAAFRPDGSTSFQALQNVAAGGVTLGYVLFDLLFVDDEDLRSLPLEMRKARLRELVATSSTSARTIQFADHIVGRGPEVWSQICGTGQVEGVMSKRRLSRYTSGRTRDWLKTKCLQRGEFVVGGFTREATGGVLRGLLVGDYVAGELVYVGRVGTGFTGREAAALLDYLNQRRRDTSPFAPFPNGSMSPPATRWGRPSRGGTHMIWVEPELVATIEFLERTDDGGLRHPIFKGLRKK